VATIDARKYKHRLGFIIGQVPVDSTCRGCALEGVQARIYIRTVPSGEMLGVFGSPQSLYLVIVRSVLPRTFFRLPGSPLDIVLFFALKLIMIFPSLGLLVIFFRFRTTLETCRHLFSIFIQKLIQWLGCACTRTLFELWRLHLTIIVRFSLSFNPKNLERSWGRSPLFDFAFRRQMP